MASNIFTCYGHDQSFKCGAKSFYKLETKLDLNEIYYCFRLGLVLLFSLSLIILRHTWRPLKTGDWTTIIFQFIEEQPIWLVLVKVKLLLIYVKKWNYTVLLKIFWCQHEEGTRASQWSTFHQDLPTGTTRIDFRSWAPENRCCALPSIKFCTMIKGLELVCYERIWGRYRGYFGIWKMNKKQERENILEATVARRKL